eukprot:3090598-Amphidinium_carterae.3
MQRKKVGRLLVVRHPGQLQERLSIELVVKVDKHVRFASLEEERVVEHEVEEITRSTREIYVKGGGPSTRSDS